MSNLASGIPIGLAIGIGAGMPMGQMQAFKDVRKNIEDFAATNTLSITDASGVSISVEQFAEIVASGNQSGSAAMRTGLIAGLLILVLAGAVVLFTVMK